MTIVGLVFFAVLDLFVIPSGVIGLIGTGAIGGGEYNADIIALSLLVRALSGIGQLAMFIYTPICFGMLLYRFAVNARAIGFTGFSYSPGWCVGWFFVPFAHLIMPYKANVEVWQSTNVSELEEIRLNDWRVRHIGRVFKAWWFTWIFGTLGNNISSRMVNSVSESIEISGYWLMTVAAFTQVASAIFAIVVISKIGSRQRAQYELVSSHSYTENEGGVYNA